MGRYWIRNRGRVQGPFTEDRIQGLLRRGRFSRSFHVSQDNKNWYPASEFPELFAGVGRFGTTADADDGPFQTGVSPFDDDDLPPAKVRASGGRSAAARRAAPVQDVDADDVEEAWEDDDGSEDADWESDSGAVGKVLDWVVANAKTIVVLLVLAVGVAGWFVFGRESFAKDAADLETLIEIKTRIDAAHSMGAQANAWLKLADDTEAALDPMVDRLQQQASSRDHVKQELLFAARDDIPQALKELPHGIRTADQRLNARFARIEDMIRQQTRQHPDSVLSLPPQPQATSPTPTADPPTTEDLEQTTPTTDNSDAPSAAPTGAPASAVPPNAAPVNSTPDRNAEPASGMAPTTPTTPPAAMNPTAPPNPAANPAAPANAVPGRPQSAKF